MFDKRLDDYLDDLEIHGDSSDSDLLSEIDAAYMKQAQALFLWHQSRPNITVDNAYLYLKLLGKLRRLLIAIKKQS